MSPFTEDLLAICRAFGLYERETICCGTVTVSQCVVMQRLLVGEEPDISSLAELLGVTRGAMTRLVDGLEGRGYVARVRSAEDRRRVAVRLTAEGRAEAERLRALTERAIGAVLERVPPDKRALVREAVGLVRAALHEARADVAACCRGAG